MPAVLRYLGTAVALIFISAILLRGVEDFPSLNFTSGRVWLGLGASIILYTLSQIFSAVAWRATLAIYEVRLPSLRAESHLLMSQIGKYVPGNVAHFLGRVALAKADRVPARVSGAALLLEAGLILLTGVLIVALLFLTDTDMLTVFATQGPELNAWLAALIVATLITVGAAAQLYVWRKAGKPKVSPARLAPPVLLYVASFACLGASLCNAAVVVAPVGDLDLMTCTAIFTAAWIAGFLMPGAPGGIGIRDGIIALGLEFFIGPGAALGAAVVHRGASVVGDVLTLALGLVARHISSVTTPLRGPVKDAAR